MRLRPRTFILATALAVLAAPAAAQAATAAARAQSQVLVRFAPLAPASARLAALAGVHGRVVGTIAPLGYAVVRVPSGSAAAAAARLDASSSVAAAAPDAVAHVLDTVPTDPAWPSQWGWADEHAPAAWDVTRGDPSVVVAVLDTGVDLTHPDLAGALAAGWDFVNNDADPTDDHGHGTAVAGIVGARANNGVGLSGWCPRCTIMPVKVIGANGAGSTSTIAQGIAWAVDHGADVLNLSLGTVSDDPALGAAVAYALAHDVVVVAAAGNAGTTEPEYPAAYPGVLSVAASDPSSALYSFSSRGAAWVRVAAPGCAVTTWAGGVYASSFCGTSAASPMVAGIAALARAAAPSATQAQVTAAIAAGATTQYPGDVQYGKVDAAATLARLGVIAAAKPVAAAPVAAPAVRPASAPKRRPAAVRPARSTATKR